MSNEKPLVELLDEIEADIASRDDSNAMHAACGEYNCDCHYMVPRLVRELRRVTTPPPTTTEEASDEYMRGFEAGCAFVMAGNEEKRSRPPTVVVPQDKVESADLTGKTMSAYPYAFTNNDGILVFRAEFLVCEPCVLLKGEECHTPECVFCFQPVSDAKSVLNKTLNCPIIDGERFILLPPTQDTASASAPSTAVPDERVLQPSPESSESSSSE